MKVPASCAVALFALALGSAADAQPTTQTSPVPVNRSGVFKFVAVINKVTPFTGTMRGYLDVSHESAAPNGGDYEESASKAVTFTGQLGKVTIVIPYKWRGADQSGSIKYNFYLEVGDCSQTATTCERSTYFNATELIPLPMANGQTITRGMSFTE